MSRLQAAQALLLESSGERYPLRLLHLTPAIDPLGRTREARLGFVDQRALPGAAGRLVWRGAAAHIPADWLVERDGRLGLFLVDGAVARFAPLPAAIEGHPAEVADLPPHSLVAGEGREALQDGDAVIIDRPSGEMP